MDTAMSSAVQVAVRVRPMSERENKGNTLPIVTASSEKNEITLIRGAANRQQRQTYSFDAVYSDISSQGDVFKKIQPLVVDVTSGYEGTVFAYGQTGTGKTHTMEGDLKNDELKGVIPRAAEAIFEHRDKYSNFTCTAQYLEIYNEELSDLLLDDVPASTPRGGFGGDSARSDTAPKLELREEPARKKGERGRVSVNNLSSHKVENPEDVLKLIQRAQERRKVGETKMNKHSSRSHCVFTLTVMSTRSTSDGGSMECTGKLHLVDLAGSECAKTAGGDKATASGADSRERERKNINQSLLTLGRVISTLRNIADGSVKADSARIPYRDSKLTRLLQESLGGRSKTVIIATLSPSVMAVEETFSTLSYAQQAAGIQNKPIATSYLKVGAPSAGMPFAGGKEGGAGGDGTTLQDWHEMECRLAYMQAQKEEAQSQLARKHLEQEAIIKRAEAAEADHAEALKALEAKAVENERMAAEIEQQGHELQVKDFILRSRSATEDKLSQQARRLLTCHERSEAEAGHMHTALVGAADAIDAQTTRRLSFNAKLLQTLQAAETQVSTLGTTLLGQRDAALAAAAKAQATFAQQATALSQRAEGMASATEGELARAADAFETVRSSAASALEAACIEIADGSRSGAASSASSQADIKECLEAVMETIKSAQATLSTTVDTTVGRQAASELQAASQRGAVSDELKATAVDVAERLRAERTRLEGHSAELRSLLMEGQSARAIEMQVRSALEALKKQESSNEGAAAERLRAVVKAIEDASAAQLRDQKDSVLLEALSDAGARLTEANSDTSATLEAQRTKLSAALEAQRAGNAVKATSAALGETRKAVDKASADRMAEAMEAACQLSSQQVGLQHLLQEQHGLLDAMKADVLSKVESLLSDHLSQLATKASSGIELAVSRSAAAVGLTSTSRAGIEKASGEFAASSDALLQATAEWGASNDDVAAQIEAAIGSSADATARIADGGAAVAKSHEGAATLARGWATSDEQCRSALSAAMQMQRTAVMSAAEATAAQATAIDALDGLGAQLIAKSDAADAQLTEGIKLVGVGRSKLEEAIAQSNGGADKAAAQLDTLGKSSEAIRKAEADSLAALNTAAATAADRSSEALRVAITKGEAANAAHGLSASKLASAAVAASQAQLGRWSEHASSEESARLKALEGVHKEAASAAAALSAHTAACSDAEMDRQAAADSAAAEQKEALTGQQAYIMSVREATQAFAEESPTEHPPLPERSPQPFEETFASTASEELLRAHYEKHGDVPFDGAEMVAPSPRRVRSMPGTSSTSSGIVTPGSARKSLTILPSPKANSRSPVNPPIVAATKPTKRISAQEAAREVAAKAKLALKSSKGAPTQGASVRRSNSNSEMGDAEETKLPRPAMRKGASAA